MKENAICKACRSGKLRRQEVPQKFEREGLEVCIDGIPALVCNRCAQVYFPPGISDEIASAANHLFMLSTIKHAGEVRAAI